MTVANWWIELRLGRIRVVIGQAKFIENCLLSERESAQSIIRYIDELKEMVDSLQKMNEDD
jgi:hypothetical protein